MAKEACGPQHICHRHAIVALHGFLDSWRCHDHDHRSEILENHGPEVHCCPGLAGARYPAACGAASAVCLAHSRTGCQSSLHAEAYAGYQPGGGGTERGLAKNFTFFCFRSLGRFDYHATASNDTMTKAQPVCIKSLHSEGLMRNQADVDNASIVWN